MKNKIKVTSILIIFLIIATLIVSCSKEEGVINPGTPGEFGLRTSLVVVVNPIINQGSSTTIIPGTQRDGIPIQAGMLPAANTNSTGLVVITDIAVNSALPIIFPTDTTFINVVQEKELYDLVVSYKNGVVEKIFPEVRYPIGGDVLIIDSTQNISDFTNQDDAIIVLKPGTYVEDINITARGVLLFGTTSSEGVAESIINGNVTISGIDVRMRGLEVSGDLTVMANDFEAAFCKFINANIQGNNILLLRNTFTQGQATVQSSNAILVDNIGIP